MGQLYAERMLSTEGRRIAKDMVSGIQRAFGETLETKSWLDTATLAWALVRLHGAASLGPLRGHGTAGWLAVSW